MDIQAQAAKVKLLLMDVDGVLTNGRLYHVVGPDGKIVEFKGFDSQDLALFPIFPRRSAKN